MKIAVVGLGHIGLPLAVQYATRGHQVTGADINPRIVEAINDGRSPHLDEQGLIEGVPRLVAAGSLRATTSSDEAVRGAEAVVVIVPVVVDGERRVDFDPIDAATRDVAAGLQRGTIVIYETTLPVGTTRDRFGPMLVKGSGLVPDDDFLLAYSPERVLVGRVLLDLHRYPKIVGGTSAAATERAVAFYGAVLDAGTEVRAVANAETAEMTKLAAGLSPLPLQRRAGPPSPAPGPGDQRGDGVLRGATDRGARRKPPRPRGPGARNRLSCRCP